MGRHLDYRHFQHVTLAERHEADLFLEELLGRSTAGSSAGQSELFLEELLRGPATRFPARAIPRGAPAEDEPVRRRSTDQAVQVVVIDPGHGGTKMVGRSSPNNAASPQGLLPARLWEKDLTLDVTRRMEAIINGRVELMLFGDMRALLTRSTDTNLALADRAKLAKDNNAAVFVSIHFNGSEKPSVDGTEVWISQPPNSGSQRLARKLLDRLLPVTGVANRGIQQRNFGVLVPSRHAPGTAACLVEVAFLSNPEQARRLADDRYRHRIALALSQGIADYLEPAARPAETTPGTAGESSRRTIWVTRAEWGADASLPRLGQPVPKSERTRVFIHHTVTPDRGDSTPNEWETMSKVHATMRGLQRSRPDLGNDVPYSVVAFCMATGDLVLCEGRGLDRSGAHTKRFNRSALGISFAGNFENTPVPAHLDAQLTMLGDWLRELRTTQGFTNLGNERPAIRDVWAHRDVKATACPGRHLFSRLALVRFVPAGALPGPGVGSSAEAFQPIEEIVTTFPPRPAGADTGTQFLKKIENLGWPKGRGWAERENAIYEELTKGNMPDFLRRWRNISVSFKDPEDKTHHATYRVTPDFLAIGSDKNYALIPMDGITAQRVADHFNAVLPTRKMVNQIYSVARRHGRNVPIDGYTKEVRDRRGQQSTDLYRDHDLKVKGRLEVLKNEGKYEQGKLVEGHKKNVIVSARLRSSPRKLAFYGFFKADGVPYQRDAPGASIIAHEDTYADYSHGVRLVHKEIIVDDQPMSVYQVLNHPVLHKLISDEGQMDMSQLRYRTAR